MTVEFKETSKNELLKPQATLLFINIQAGKSVMDWAESETFTLLPSLKPLLWRGPSFRVSVS